MSQVGRQAPSLVRLGWDFSQTLCSPGRGSPTLCRSWRGSRPRPLSWSASRRSPPCLSLRRSPARSRCRSGWRSRSGRGCRSGSRSLGRARGSRVLDVSSMARSRVPAPERPEDNNPTASFPGRWPNLGGGARTAGRDGHLRARALAPPRPAARSPERAHRQEAPLCAARGTAPGCRCVLGGEPVEPSTPKRARTRTPTEPRLPLSIPSVIPQGKQPREATSPLQHLGVAFPECIHPLAHPCIRSATHPIHCPSLSLLPLLSLERLHGRGS